MVLIFIILDIYYTRYTRCFIEEIDRSNDKYLVVVSSLRNNNVINALDKVCSSIKDKINPSIKIKDLINLDIILI